MISKKPYFLRAFYEWIVASNCTPYILVNAKLPKVAVPQSFVQEGQIILNISPNAVQDLRLEGKYVSFSATFSGVVQDVYAPIQAIEAIYAKENGDGMAFEGEEFDDIDVEEGTSGDKGKGKKSHLEIV